MKSNNLSTNNKACLVAGYNTIYSLN